MSSKNRSLPSAAILSMERACTATRHVLCVMLLPFWLGSCAVIPIPSADQPPLAYIASTESNSVTVLNTETDAIVATIPEIQRPWDVRATPNGRRVYVGGEGRTVVIIDPDRQVVTNRLEVGQSSTSLAVSQDGKALYVADVKNNIVSVFSTETDQLLARIPVGPVPTAIVPTPFLKFYVASYFSGTVKVVSALRSLMVDSIPVGEFPMGMALRPDGRTLYVASQRFPSVSVIDTQSDRVVATIAVEGSPTGIAVSPDGSRLYVTNPGLDTVSVISTNIDRVIASIPVGEVPWGVAVTPDGKKVYVTNIGSDTLSIIDTATNRVTATIEGIGNNPTGIAILSRHP